MSTESHLAVVVEEVHNVVNGRERKGRAGVRAAVVDANSACVCVNKVSAGECYRVCVADKLVVRLGADKVGRASLQDFPRLVLIEESGGEAVHITVAGGQYAVVENEPAAVCLYRDRTCAHFCGLPTLGGSHNVSVFAPVFEVGGLADIHIAERSVSAVGGTAHHNVFVVYLAGEHNAVSVERQVCVFKLCEFLEIIGVSNADSGLPAVSVAPCYNVSVLALFVNELAYAGVVAVLPLAHLGDIAFEFDTLLVDVPVDAVLGEACVDLHVALSVVNAENACELVVAYFKGYYGAVEDRVGGFSVAVSLFDHDMVALDNGVSVVAPNHVSAICGFFLPWDIGE